MGEILEKSGNFVSPESGNHVVLLIEKTYDILISSGGGRGWGA